MAAPIVVLIVSLSLLDGALTSASPSQELSASVMRLSEGEVLRLPQGGAILYSGHGFSIEEDKVEFLDGSALLKTNGYMEVEVAGNRFATVSGSFHLSYHGGGITVAALTAPVLFRDASRLMVVPLGMQWKISDEEKITLLPAGFPLWREARQVQELPERFIVRQLQNLAFIPDEESVLPIAQAEPLPLWTKFSSLRIGSTKDGIEQDWIQGVLGAFRSIVESGDEDRADVFLNTFEYSEVLRSDEAWNMMMRLLLFEPQGTPMRSFLLSHLLEDENFWLLTSLHPDFSTEVWSLFTEHRNPEAVVLRLFLLPTANTAQKSVQKEEMQRWVYELSQIARGEKAISLVHAMVEQHLPLIALLEQRGYPERSRTLAIALKTLVENTEITLPLELSSQLEDSLSFNRVSLEGAPLAEVIQEEEQVEIVKVQKEELVHSYSPDTVENRAYDVFSKIGALFTVETSIDAIAPNTAEIRNIIFSAPSGDRKVDLLFDVAKGEVRNIFLGNKEYPYALSLEAFKDWIQG